MPYKRKHDELMNMPINAGAKRALDEIKGKEDFAKTLESMSVKATGQYSGEDPEEAVKRTYKSDER